MSSYFRGCPEVIDGHPVRSFLRERDFVESLNEFDPYFDVRQQTTSKGHDLVKGTSLVSRS